MLLDSTRMRRSSDLVLLELPSQRTPGMDWKEPTGLQIFPRTS